MTRILSVFGTRPEAIKMAPVVLALSAEPGIDAQVCVTGQHREMLDQVLELFKITPEYDLAIMKNAQTLHHVTSAVLEGLGEVLEKVQPDWVLVHGDTTTTMAASLAAYYAKVSVGHVEAGLRTGNIYSPWPEEMNRMIAGRVARAHFAPTASSEANLLAENVDPASILVTGNTVIDALYWVRDNVLDDPAQSAEFEERFSFLDPEKRLILVTGHRRESFDGGLDRVCAALTTLASRNDVQIVYPVHLNPVVQKAASALSELNNVFLVEPADYLPFVWLMQRSSLIITDSGGVQEEAPALGKPVLVTRDTTERPEAVDAGVVDLVGTNTEAIISAATALLDDAALYERMSNATSPYGDGHAAERIVAHLKQS